MNIQLGNESPIGTTGNRITTIRLADDISLVDVLRIVCDPGGVWAAHSTADVPAWIESDNATIQMVLRDNYKVGDRPAGWVEATDVPIPVATAVLPAPEPVVVAPGGTV